MKMSNQSLGSLFGTLALTVLLNVGGGCAGNRYSESTGEYIDDSAVTAKVKSALVADKDVKAGDVKVETFKGVVQLSGFVDNNYEKQKAEDIARTIKGVAAVDNKIAVK